MRIYVATAIAVLSLLSGCEQQPSVCEGPTVRDGVVRGFTSDQSSAEYGLIKNLQLKEIRTLQKDESTGVTECAARLIVPTDRGPLDSPIEYRVGPSAKTGESVFMVFTLSKEVEELWGRVVFAAGQTTTR